MWTAPIATLVLFNLFWLGRGCDFNYTVQPPHDIFCNPYVSNALYLECAIKGANLLKIQWYFSPSGKVDSNNNDIRKLHSSTKYTIETIHENSSFIKSQLTTLGFYNNSDAGGYWCGGILNDNTTLQTFSSMLVVKSRNHYSNTHFGCTKSLIFRNSHSKCTVQTTTEIHFESSSTSTEIHFESSSTSTELHFDSSSTPATTEVLTQSTQADQLTSPWAVNYILIVTLCLVVVLLLVCIVLMIIIGLQCRKRRNHKRFQENSGQFLRSITQSAESQFNRKESSGEYAEIGPAIIATVAQHMTDNPHYSPIDGSMLKPPQTKSCTNPLLQHLDNHIIENPYDTLTSPKELNGAANEVDKSYSRLDRVVSSGGPIVEKNLSISGEAPEQTEGSKHTEVFDQTTNSQTTTISEETGKVAEHPYYILEKPKDTIETSSSSDTESWSSNSCQSIHLPKDSGISLENHDALASPVDEERYQTSDNFSFHDTQRNTYDHLEAHDTTEMKYQNLDYLEPVSMINNNKLPKENSPSCSKEGSESSVKYSGDYERDPSYMERAHNSETPSSHYQTLVESTMEPSDNYTKLNSLCK